MMQKRGPALPRDVCIYKNDIKYLNGNNGYRSLSARYQQPCTRFQAGNFLPFLLLVNYLRGM